MGTRRIAIVICVALVVAASLSASGVGEPVPDRIVVGISGSPDTLDPQATTGTLTFQTMRSVYDTLVEPNADGEIVPALATSWTVSDDGLVWRFSLRDGVTFHHGRPFGADDVVATLNRMRDPDRASPSAFEYEMISDVRAVDARTVALTLNAPHAPLLATLASGWSAILPADLIAADHDFASAPVGTGPFRFATWNRGETLTLVRNDDYWIDGAPRVATLEFRTITEQAVMAQALLAGAIHVADILVEPELSLVQESRGAVAESAPSSLVLVVPINTRRPPLDDPAFRGAMAAAIDRRSVLDVAYAGGEVVSTFMDASNPYYVNFDFHGYDPDAARAYFDANPVSEPLVMRLPRNFEPHVRAGELYQEMWRQVGLPVDLELIDWTTWLEEVYRDARFDLTVIGHTGKLDPDGRLAQFGTDQTYVGWENEVAAQAIAAARVTPDVDERRGLYATALEEMARELPFIFIGSPYRFTGRAESLSGLVVDARLDTFDFRRAEFQ